MSQKSPLPWWAKLSFSISVLLRAQFLIFSYEKKEKKITGELTAYVLVSFILVSSIRVIPDLLKRYRPYPDNLNNVNNNELYNWNILSPSTGILRNYTWKEYVSVCGTVNTWPQCIPYPDELISRYPDGILLYLPYYGELNSSTDQILERNCSTNKILIIPVE
jgi:hypothetical protein